MHEQINISLKEYLDERFSRVDRRLALLEKKIDSFEDKFVTQVEFNGFVNSIILRVKSLEDTRSWNSRSFVSTVIQIVVAIIGGILLARLIP